MKPSRIGLAVRLASAAGLGLLAGTHALASGFAIPEASIAGLGTTNALVANPEEPGAIPYNPAAMGFHESSIISAGLMVFNPNLQVVTAGGEFSSEGEDYILIPSLQGVYKANADWSLGLGITAPFGLETNWPLGTFPKLSVALGPIPAGILQPSQSKLELLDISPTVALRVNDALSLSAGLDYYDARELIFDTYGLDIKGDGNAWGWNLSAMYRSGPVSIGASYHSAATVGVSGTYHAYGLGLPPEGARADLDLPSRLQLGIRYAFDDRLALEFDWSRTGWSDFTEILVVSETDGSVLATSANYWEDANAYRLGLTYGITDTTQVRLGYTYDETGQTDEYFSARVPDADRQLFSIGVAHELGGGWSVEGGYMYVLFEDHHYSSNRRVGRNLDVNGTATLNGDYSAAVHIVGIGVNKTF